MESGEEEVDDVDEDGARSGTVDVDGSVDWDESEVLYSETRGRGVVFADVVDFDLDLSEVSEGEYGGQCCSLTTCGAGSDHSQP
jgi:hypothetical protein